MVQLDLVDTGKAPHKVQVPIAAAEFAIECVRAGTSDILLAHLSDENNSPQLAEYTVGRALQSSGLSVRLAAAPRDTISEVHVCRRSPSFASEN